MTDVIRAALRRYVVGALAVACFVGGGYLAAGYLHPAQATPVTTTVDQTKVWNDLQRRADDLRRNLPPVAPTPAPTHDTERSV